MFRLVLVLALAASAYGYGRIVGGEKTDIEKYNYQVSLELFRSHRCGGSLIKRNVVVTAAHCVDGTHSYIDYLTIRAGATLVEEGGEVLSIKNVHQDARYDSSNIDYDIAILILDGEFTLSEKIGTIDLVGRGSSIIAGTPSEVTGWGSLREGGNISPQLQVVSVPNVDRDECIASYDPYTVTVRMSCWGYPEGKKDACQGDSGGPLVIRNEEGTRQLAGVVSWGLGCARKGYPGIYTDLTNEEIHDFITKNANVE